MKLTKARLKEIIEEELGEVIRPRMSVGSSGLRPPGVPAAAPPEPETPVEEPAPAPSDPSRDKLWSMVNAYIKFAKNDPNVPDHIHYALTKIAQEIAKG